MTTRDRHSSQDRPVISTMWCDDAPRWNTLVEVVRSERPGRPKDLLALLRAARGAEAVILHGAVTLSSCYRDLVFAILVKWTMPRRSRPTVLITDATWEVGSRRLASSFPLVARLVPTMARLLIRMLDGAHVRYGVLSTDERRSFPQTWGVDAERVVFTPFPATLGEVEGEVEGEGEAVRDDGFLFAGGNPMRDYPLLEQALDGTGFPARIAADWTPSAPMPNARTGRVSHDQFVEDLATCRAVVVPLLPSIRSAGQQTYLNAMALGKPPIVTDAPGVRDYVEHGVTGVVVEPRPEALRAAIAHVMDPANVDHYQQMGRRARAVVAERFTMVDYFDTTMLAAAGFPPN